MSEKLVRVCDVDDCGEMVEKGGCCTFCGNDCCHVHGNALVVKVDSLSNHDSEHREAGTTVRLDIFICDDCNENVPTGGFEFGEDVTAPLIEAVKAAMVESTLAEGQPDRSPDVPPEMPGPPPRGRSGRTIAAAIAGTPRVGAAKAAAAMAKGFTAEQAAEIIGAPPPDLPGESTSGCQHGITFDQDVAAQFTTSEIRERWPRLHGPCPLLCGYTGYHYASQAHFHMGDW